MLLISCKNRIKNIDEFLYIPIVRSSEKTWSYTTTRHPVENGEEIADHRTKKPLKLTVNVIIPNKSPKTSGSTSNSIGRNNPFAAPSSNISQVIVYSDKQDVLTNLQALADNNEILSLFISGEPIYDDMIIDDIRNKEDNDSGDAYRLEIVFTHVKFVNSSRGTIPDEIKSKLAKDKKDNGNDASGNVDKGQPYSTPAGVLSGTSGTAFLPNRAINYSDSNRIASKYKGKVDLTSPVPGAKITSYFGSRKNPITGNPENHKAIDLAATLGTPIYSASRGKVISAGDFGDGYGKTISIDNGNGLIVNYHHLSEIPNYMVIGKEISQSDFIGKVGSTGNSTGAHLDFQIIDKKTKTALDPTILVKGV